MRLVEKRVFIDAPPARVYELLTDAELLVEWMAPVADLDPNPGGVLTWTHENGDRVVGAYVELVPAPAREQLAVSARDRSEERFWKLACPLLAQAGVTRSTMMGFPCLRLDGDFFASCDRRTGNLVVKLDEPRVAELLAAGDAEPFAPNGRRFREWATIPLRRQRSWERLLDEALQLAAARRSASRYHPTKRSGASADH